MKKILSEASSLTLENQKLASDVQHWKDRVLQEQMKREAAERELQELRTRLSDPTSGSRSVSDVHHSQDSKSIPEAGLHRRRPSLGGSIGKDIATESKLSDKDQNKLSDNLTSSSHTMASSSSSDSKGSTGNKMRSLLSRDLKRPQASDLNTPLVIKGWFQIILLAAVFFVLGRLFRP